MANKKDLIIAILSTFCLSVKLFAVLPTRSQSGTEYDPWADMNDDGQIDMIHDIRTVAKLFGATGDPTKNVTITGRANKLAYSVRNQPILANGAGIATPYIDVDGYSKITICVCLPLGVLDNGYELWANANATKEGFLVDQMTDFDTFVVKTYDVPNQQIQIYLVSWDVVDRWYNLDVYLIP